MPAISTPVRIQHLLLETGCREPPRIACSRQQCTLAFSTLNMAPVALSVSHTHC